MKQAPQMSEKEAEKLAGRISSRTFEVYFDGGFNGTVYGSWEVFFNGFSKKVLRQQFIGAAVESSNTAEYLSLMSALQWLTTVKDKKQYEIKVYTDSEIVLNQVIGKYKCQKEHLMIYRNVVLAQLQRWRVWHFHWHSRRNNVARFGH